MENFKNPSFLLKYILNCMFRSLCANSNTSFCLTTPVWITALVNILCMQRATGAWETFVDKWLYRVWSDDMICSHSSAEEKIKKKEKKVQNKKFPQIGILSEAKHKAGPCACRSWSSVSVNNSDGTVRAPAGACLRPSFMVVTGYCRLRNLQKDDL